MEHGLYAYCGGLGSGKTYAMTCDILKALDEGEIVATNYDLKWGGNEKKQIPKENLIRLPNNPKEIMKMLAVARNMIFALDEGYIYFDSYSGTSMSIEDRIAILQCRKRRCSLWYTTQRPMAVQKTLRSMTNIFYRCDKIKWPFLGIYFRKQAFDPATEVALFFHCSIISNRLL